MSEVTSEIISTLPELHLNSLSTGVPALTVRKAGVHMEACIWCLLECDHSNGIVLTVDEGGAYSNYRLCWPEEDIDINAINRAYNEDDGPEQGAEAIAFLLIRERTDYTAIKRSTTSTGIDYWLDYKANSQSQLFSNSSARLEVSGILRQSITNRPEYRSRKKIEQTKQSDHTSFPAYIIIVEFSQPTSKVIFRNVTR